MLATMYMSTSSKLKETFTKPLVVGLVSALGATAMGQNFKVDITMLGVNGISAPVFYGVLGATSSLAAESLGKWVLPYLPQSESMAQMEAAALAPALSAATNVLAIKLLCPAMLDHPMVGYKTPLILGAGAEFVGTCAFDNFIKNMDWMR